MKIAVMAGSSCNKIETVLRKYTLDLKLFPELSEGLQQVTMSMNVDQMLIMDEALVKEGKLLDLVQVFTAMDEMRPINPDMEILFVTRSETAYSVFSEVMATNPRARCELVTRLNSNILFECINGSFKEVVQEVVEEVAPDLGSILLEVENRKVEQEPVAERIKIVKEPKTKKDKDTKGRIVRVVKENLKDLVLMNQIILVTGNHNSGTTSTFCAMADVLQQEGVDVLMVDLDIYNKGVNMYYKHLDGGCNVTVKSGLKNALNNLDSLADSILRITPTLSLLGTTSETSHKFLWDTLELREETCDMLQMLAEDFRIVLVHIPIETLLNNPTLVRDCNSIVYCTNGTINGIYNIDKNLNKQHLIDRDRHSTYSILQRKTNYILTNHIKNTIKPEQWLKFLLDITGEKGLHQHVLGVIPHLSNFDDFHNTKNLITGSKPQYANIYNILTNLFRV